jgi:sodium transport system permease protein
MARRPADHLPLRAANAALTLAVVSVLVLGSLLASVLGESMSGLAGQLGTIGLQVLAFALPAVLVCWASDVQITTALGLSFPPARVIVGAILVGSSFWLVNATFIAPLGLELFGGREELEKMSQHFADAPLLMVLVSTAVTPAICEELLFRGAFARAIAARTGLTGAVVVSALVFAAIHFPLARMLPALATGLVLGYVALASGSTLAAMLVHLINNSIAIALAHLAEPDSSGAEIATPVWMVMAAALTVMVGTALVWGPHRASRK